MLSKATNMHELWLTLQNVHNEVLASELKRYKEQGYGGLFTCLAMNTVVKQSSQRIKRRNTASDHKQKSASLAGTPVDNNRMEVKRSSIISTTSTTTAAVRRRHTFNDCDEPRPFSVFSPATGDRITAEKLFQVRCFVVRRLFKWPQRLPNRRGLRYRHSWYLNPAFTEPVAPLANDSF